MSGRRPCHTHPGPRSATSRCAAKDDLEAADASVWRDIFDVNVIGAWQLTTAAVPHLRESGAGSIVNVSSVSATRALGSSSPTPSARPPGRHSGGPRRGGPVPDTGDLYDRRCHHGRRRPPHRLSARAPRRWTPAASAAAVSSEAHPRPSRDWHWPPSPAPRPRRA
ncbi:SDR family oxidoreductase [Streptomyces sp. NPDC057376]|uniref:SDR family oxidoreductase n=1 Tax=unclassified Streptomyces TaxID=2593676 RepID=UPI0009A0AD9C